MKTIRNKLIPFKGFKAVNLFGVIFVREEFFPLDAVEERHEMIHTRQMREMLYAGFYVWYLAEWLIRLLLCFNFKQAYRGISLEREARCNEAYKGYQYFRRHYAWLKYLFKQ